MKEMEIVTAIYLCLYAQHNNAIQRVLRNENDPQKVGASLRGFHQLLQLGLEAKADESM